MKTELLEILEKIVNVNNPTNSRLENGGVLTVYQIPFHLINEAKNAIDKVTVSLKTEDEAAEVTLQQCENQVAKEAGHKDWAALKSEYHEVSDYFHNKVAELYASQVSASKDREIEELKFYMKAYSDVLKLQTENHGQLAKTISDQSKTIEELKELLMDCFSQACSIEESGTKYYDHMCLSTYEATQEFLVRHGVIKQEECYRP